MALSPGSRLPVSNRDVFPHGCCLVPDSITEAQDYDERTRRRTPSVDKLTGRRVWQCRVSDMDPALAGRSRETVIKILSDAEPQPPTGQDWELVDFEGLTVTPYVDSGRCQGQGRCGARMAFSLRATGLKAAARTAPVKDAA